MSLSFTKEFTVHHYECDPWLRMTPGAMLRRIQEVSTEQCESLGLDEPYYQSSHSAFLLSRMSLVIRQAVGPVQRVRAVTEALGMQRAVFHRMTTLYNEAGGVLCQADTRWVLADTETRRIIRRPPEPVAKVFGHSHEPGEADHDMKLKKPQSIVPISAETCRYTQCDRNSHLNNTRYADLMCDHLPLAALEAGLPRQMLLVYHSEIPLCETFTLSGAHDTQNSFYFLAHKDENKYFEGQVRF